LFTLVYIKTYALQVVQGRLFCMGQSKANQRLIFPWGVSSYWNWECLPLHSTAPATVLRGNS